MEKRLQEEIRENAQIYNEIGQIYKGMGKIETSINFFENPFSIAKEINDFLGMTSILFNMSNAYFKKGKKSLSLNFLLNALNSLIKVDQENTQLAIRIKKKISFMRNKT